MPIGLKLQKKLELGAGLMDIATIDEILMVCRRDPD
jgi:hypothetical protein